MAELLHTQDPPRNGEGDHAQHGGGAGDAQQRRGALNVTTGPIRGSRKVHVGPLGVAMREIHLEPGCGEPPLRVYDPSGPYTDSEARIDIMAGLPSSAATGSAPAAMSRKSRNAR
jgi:hypothetical protein